MTDQGNLGVPVPAPAGAISVGVEIKAIPDGLIDKGDHYLVSLLLNPIAEEDCEHPGDTVPLENWPSAIAGLHGQLRVLWENKAHDAQVVDCISAQNRKAKTAEIDALWRMAMRLDDPVEWALTADHFASGLKVNQFVGETITYPQDLIAYAHQAMQGAVTALQAARLSSSERSILALTSTLNHRARLSRHSELVGALYQLTAEAATNDDLVYRAPRTNGAGPQDAFRREVPPNAGDVQQISKLILRRIANAGRTRRAALEKIDDVEVADFATSFQPYRVGKPMALAIAAALSESVSISDRRRNDVNLSDHLRTLSAIDGNSTIRSRTEAEQHLLREISRILLPGYFTESTFLSSEQSPFARAHALYRVALMPESGKENSLTSRQLATAKANQDEEESSKFVRRLTGLYAHPQVAALFGLIVDLKVPKEALYEGSSAIGELSAKIIGEIAHIAHRTETDIDKEKFAARPMLPDPRPATDDDAKLDESGLLALGSDRFEITALDANAAVEGGVNAHNNDVTGLNNGEMISEQESGTPAHRTAGLAILDKEAVNDARIEQWVFSRRKLQAAANKTPKGELLHLEDLIAGYRIDVGVGLEKGREWFSLFNRVITYPDVEQAGIRLATGHPMFVRERSNGYARKAHRETKLSEQQDLAVVFPTLVTWRNWSLAVPQRRHSYELTDDEKNKTPNGELQLSVVMRPPRLGQPLQDGREAQRKDLLPPQRIGQRYSFGARIVLANGSSISFDEAAHLYRAKPKDNVLSTGVATNSAPADSGYPFLRHEPIAGPLVLDPEQPDYEEQKKDEQRLPTDYAALTDTIAVTSDDPAALKWNSNTRLVLAGGVPFELCELSGAFDSFKSSLPSESYKSIVKRLGGEAELYYADPMAQVMMIGFFKDGDPAWPGEYPAPIAIDLGEKWPKLDPVTIEIVPTANAGGSLAGSGLRAAFGRFKDGRIAIEIEPAEIAEILIWFVPRELKSLDRLAGFRQMVHFAEKLVKATTEKLDKSPLNPLLEGLRKIAAFGSGEPGRLTRTVPVENRSTMSGFAPLYDGPLTGICHAGRLTAVHAVEKPIERPVIRNLWGLHRIDDDKDGTASEEVILETWSKLIVDETIDGNSSPGGYLSEQKEGSQHFLLICAVEFDRKSTSELQLLGAWKDYGPHTLPRKNKQGYYDDQPDLRCDPVAEVKPISYEPGASGDTNLLDLVLDPARRPRLLHLKLKSTRAVELLVAADARSRFARYFEKNEEERSLPDVGQSPEDAPLRFPREPRHVRRSDEFQVLKIPATRRPDPVELLGIESAIYLDGNRLIKLDTDGRPSALHNLKRTVRLRLKLGQQWYSSGIGEQLGIVCWPADLFTSPDGSIHEKVHDDSTFPAFATVWGRDPIRETGEVSRLLPASTFVNCKKTATAKVPIPIADDSGETDGFKLCALALFDVQVDPDTGERYCDVEMDPGGSYNPFVRLGLVRYQECCLDGLHASAPIIEQVSVMPSREIVVEKIADGFSLRYSGTVYSEMNFGRAAEPSAVVAKNSTPLLDVTLMQRVQTKAGNSGKNSTESGNLSGVVTRYDHSGLPVPLGSGASTAVAEIANLQPTSLVDHHAEWQVNFAMATDRPSAVVGGDACGCGAELSVAKEVFAGGIFVLLREKELLAADIDSQFSGEPGPVNEPTPGSRWVERVVCSSALDIVMGSTPEPLKGK